MKIAYLSVFYPYRGGISQFNAALYRELEKSNEVKAFTFTRQYPDFLFPGKTQYVKADDEADKIPALRILDSINPFSYCKTARKIIEYGPDLLLIQNWMPFFAPSLGWVARKVRKKGVPVISLMANIKPHEPKPGDNMLNRFYMNQNDAFVVLAEAVKNDLLDIRPDAKYFQHPHPNYEHFGKAMPKEDARERLKIPMDKKVLFFFGLVRKYKGLDILLETLKDLPEEYHVLAAGEVYGSFSEYEQIITKNNMESRCHLHLKYINDEDVSLYFSAADVCVLPYRTATQSGIVGVSYSLGLPVISTDVGGLKEVIEPYGAGIVIDRPDPGLLREAVMGYFTGGNRVEYVTNVDNFSRKYTWKSLAEGITDMAGEL